MAYRSLLILQVHPGTRAEAVKAYHDRRILEECQESIPEFIAGRVGLSDLDGDRICIEVEWSDSKGWRDWMAHPVRLAQGEDFGPYVKDLVHVDIYEI